MQRHGVRGSGNFARGLAIGLTVVIGIVVGSWDHRGAPSGDIPVLIGLGAVGLAVLLRSLRIRVVLTEVQLEARGWFWTRRFARSDLRWCTSTDCEGMLAAGGHAPFWGMLKLTLADDREVDLPSTVAWGGASRRQAESIQAWLKSTRDGDLWRPGEGRLW